ncbi:MAG: transposase, partial [Polyangiaceae bacterium]
MAVLAPAYLPRRPTETVLYGVVRQHLESFLAHAREHYDGGLPRYVEAELRAYLDCGVFARGFTRAYCDACGHDLLVAFTCKSRTVCPSCSGRRMANTAAAIVDRVLPDVPVRQYVLSLPYEPRKLAAFQAEVLTALGRIFVDAIFASYRARAQQSGVEDGQGGAINFVQRFGSLNLNVHFHVVVPDGVFTRGPGAGVVFHPAAAPTREQLEAIVQRVHDRAEAWLRRRGHLDERPTEERSSEPPLQTALDACAAIAIGRGQGTMLSDAEAPGNDQAETSDKPVLAIERNGFNLHAGLRIQAGDDLGRERLCRYGARPPLSLERLRRLPGGRVAYRLKYVSRGRGKHRVMTAMEFMARLAAIIAPPRYPLVRYAGVLGPRSSWRKDIVPKPREPRPSCDAAADEPSGGDTDRPRAEPRRGEGSASRPDRPMEAYGPSRQGDGGAAMLMLVPGGFARPGDVVALP